MSWLSSWWRKHRLKDRMRRKIDILVDQSEPVIAEILRGTLQRIIRQALPSDASDELKVFSDRILQLLDSSRLAEEIVEELRELVDKIL